MQYNLMMQTVHVSDLLPIQYHHDHLSVYQKHYVCIIIWTL